MIIEIHDLRKYFVMDRSLHKQLLFPFISRKKICALQGISFSIDSGEILGVVGHNGAGKTTLLRLIANLLEADSGYIKLCGQELNGKSDTRANIGYVSNDERSFFWRLTGRQNLEFFASLYGVRKSLAKARIGVLLNWFNLERKAEDLFCDYSTGTRKKFSIARALIHQPKVLLLDEVTNSLDPISTKNVKSLVRGYISNHSEVCAIWSTHRVEEIFEVCDKILIIHNGQSKFFGNPLDLKSKYGNKFFLLDDNDEEVICCLNNMLEENC